MPGWKLPPRPTTVHPPLEFLLDYQATEITDLKLTGIKRRINEGETTE